MMIKVLEKEYLNDCFIEKKFVKNININEKLIFNKINIYYFGNYDKNEIYKIKNKLLKNKKNIINAVEKGIKIIISGNSCELFNNSFEANNINLFTYIPIYNKHNCKIKYVDNLKDGIYANNFKYKNLICITNEKNIIKILKNKK